MTMEFTDRCRRCAWTNERDARHCRGCGELLRRGASLPLRSAGYRRSTLIGTVTSDPRPLMVPYLDPSWFIIAAVAVTAETGARLERPTVVTTTVGLLAVAVLIQRGARSRNWVLARIARTLAPIRMRTGMRLGVTDVAGTAWILDFLPIAGTDLHVGDPMFADGHENRGEFRALRLTNVRTGYRHISLWSVLTGIASTCTVVVAALLIVAP